MKLQVKIKISLESKLILLTMNINKLKKRTNSKLRFKKR